MTKRLTEKSLERLHIPKHKYYEVYDSGAPGLLIKVTPAGKKIWMARLVYPGNKAQAKRTLGLFPGMKIEQARETAQEWHELVKQGKDPAKVEAERRTAEREQEEAKRRAEMLKRENNFASVAEKYMAERSNNRRAKIDEREIRRMLVAAWGGQPIDEIEPRDVRKLIEKFKLDTPYDAKNAWSHAVGIFQFAVFNEMLTVSPCASLNRKMLFKNAKIAPRQRVLNETEIGALWQASGKLGYPYGPFYQLLLLTGVRVNELAKAQWNELNPTIRKLIREAGQAGNINWAAVDDSVKSWTIPRERFKSDAEHLVPLSDQALAILETLPQFAGCDFLFTTNGKIPINGFSKAKAQLDAEMLRTLKAAAKLIGDNSKATELNNWVNHDLRRVVRTNLSGLDVADHVAEMVIGHGRKGIQRVYDQHRYEAQLRDALERWATKLRSIVTPAPATPPASANIVSLASGRGARR